VSTPVPAADFTHDATIVLDSSQIGNTSDGVHPGRSWEATLSFPAPVTVNAGDTLQGTVSFGADLLRLRDNGGGYTQVGDVLGLEQIGARANTSGALEVSEQDNVVRFTDVRGAALATGDARLGNVNHNGLFLGSTIDLVSTAEEIVGSGLTYRLGLVSGGPFTVGGVVLRVSAEEVGIESRPPGDLAYRTCISGDDGTGPDGTRACSLIEGATEFGANSGLDNLRSVAESADGKSVYVVSGFDDAVAHFNLDSATGAFIYEGCITGELTATMACTEIGSASLDGIDSGLDLLQSVALSPDGTSLYTASISDDAVAHFTRDPATGILTYQGCLTGEAESDECTRNDFTTAGANSGRDGLRSIALTADGTSLYAIAPDDDAIAHFARDPSTGALTYVGCISGETESGPMGSEACALIDSATSGGADSGLDFLFAVGVSADGMSVYAVSQFDDAVARFARDRETGALTYQGCITGETQSGPTGTDACTQIASAASFGTDSGLDNPFALAVSGDGASLYAVAENDDAVVRFDRDPATGALTHQGCISGKTETGPTGTNACVLIESATSFGTNSGLDKLRSLGVSPDGLSVYTASPQDDAIARFDRDPASGALTYQACITAENESGSLGSNACARIGSAASFGVDSGLDNPQAFVVSADGLSLYTASGNDAAVARFDREPEPPPTTTTTTSTTTTTQETTTSATTTTAPTSTTATTQTTTSTTTDTAPTTTTTSATSTTQPTSTTTTTQPTTTSTIATTTTTSATTTSAPTTTRPTTTSTSTSTTTSTTMPTGCEALPGLEGIECQLRALAEFLEATSDEDLAGLKEQLLKRFSKAVRLIERAQTAKGRLATANPRRVRILLKGFIGALERRVARGQIDDELADELIELAGTIRSQLLPFTKR
jgi:6-phosphogluconolactonase (cycloisomerase 2 family)